MLPPLVLPLTSCYKFATRSDRPAFVATLPREMQQFAKACMLWHAISTAHFVRWPNTFSGDDAGKANNKTNCPSFSGHIFRKHFKDILRPNILSVHRKPQLRQAFLFFKKAHKKHWLMQ
jgi:hypothetical protein